jgi:hypothetical protein
MPLLLKCLLEITLVVGQVQITLMAKGLEARIQRVQHTYSEKIAEMKCSSGKVLDNLHPVNVPHGVANHMITGREPIISSHSIKKHKCTIRLHASGCSFDNFGPVTHTCMALRSIIVNWHVVSQRKAMHNLINEWYFPSFLGIALQCHIIDQCDYIQETILQKFLYKYIGLFLRKVASYTKSLQEHQFFYSWKVC